MNNVSFTSRPIFDVTLKTKARKGNPKKEVQATFSEFSPDDIEDCKAMEKLAKSWQHSKYGGVILSDFEMKREFSTGDFFYGIELKGNEPLDKRIVALGSIMSTRNDIPYIKYIQSASHVSNKKTQKYNGAGAMLLYGMVKEAKEYNQPAISLCTTDTSKDFYNKIGFTKYTEHDEKSDILILSNDRFDDFTSSIEKKYNLSPKTNLDK